MPVGQTILFGQALNSHEGYLTGPVSEEVIPSKLTGNLVTLSIQWKYGHSLALSSEILQHSNLLLNSNNYAEFKIGLNFLLATQHEYSPIAQEWIKQFGPGNPGGP